MTGATSSTSSVVAAPPDEETLTQIASSILRSNVQAQRVGLSFVIAVSYDSPDPLLSAKIANAYTDAYVEDQFNAQVATAQRAADWLHESNRSTAVGTLLTEGAPGICTPGIT